MQDLAGASSHGHGIHPALADVELHKGSLLKHPCLKHKLEQTGPASPTEEGYKEVYKATGCRLCQALRLTSHSRSRSKGRQREGQGLLSPATACCGLARTIK